MMQILAATLLEFQHEIKETLYEVWVSRVKGFPPKQVFLMTKPSACRITCCRTTVRLVRSTLLLPRICRGV